MGLRSTFGTLSARSLALEGLVLLAIAGTLAGPTPRAFAHAAFVDSTPEPGKRVGAPPSEITLKFTESLNLALSKATLVDAETGKPVPAKAEKAPQRSELVLRPTQRLPRAPYRVKWHTVSTVDGHALEGTFNFGVRTAALGGEGEVEQSPLARSGWLRIALRALFYAALFFFAGGVLNAALLGGSGRPASWLVPEPTRSLVTQEVGDVDDLRRRLWRRTLDAGWIAALLGAATALAEARDAGGDLSPRTLNDYLLSTGAGLARVTTVIALAVAALAAGRSRVIAAGWTMLALASVALAGHANSADPRVIAVLTDWTHLVFAAIWVGGIAQIAAAWLPAIRRASRALRLTIARSVLARFGTIALPAFLIVVATGVVNALIELGAVKELWENSYGRVLLVKITLVALIAGASYWHALRLRPKLLGANPHPDARLERRHWRLLSIEPAVAIGVVAAAAALVAFPLPPRQLNEGDEAKASVAPCNPCPLRKPRPDELSVAERAGSQIAGFWLRRSGEFLEGTVRLLDDNGSPVNEPIRLLGGKLVPCGVGCWRFKVPATANVVSVVAEEGGKEYRASVPARWLPGANATARRIVERAQTRMRAQPRVVEDERVTSGPGTFVRTIYQLQAPDRFTYKTDRGVRSVVIGRHQWDRTPGQPWQAGQFGGLTGFRTKDFFRWTPYAVSARLLSFRTERGRRVADLALMDPATPVWFRLKVDLASMRIAADRMVTEGHFMSRRYLFDRRFDIVPPSRSVRSK